MGIHGMDNKVAKKVSIGHKRSTDYILARWGKPNEVTPLVHPDEVIRIT